MQDDLEIPKALTKKSPTTDSMQGDDNETVNPTHGVIATRPNGPNAYAGVPKDYTASDHTVQNILAVTLGDKNAVKGGSGKVMKSGPNGHVFLYFSSHGSYGTFG
ncbi:hypothetical protein Ancab_023007 [Ancistrocladus abbreviatus]